MAERNIFSELFVDNIRTNSSTLKNLIRNHVFVLETREDGYSNNNRHYCVAMNEEDALKQFVLNDKILLNDYPGTLDVWGEKLKGMNTFIEYDEQGTWLRKCFFCGKSTVIMDNITYPCKPCGNISTLSCEDRLRLGRFALKDASFIITNIIIENT